MKRAILLLTFLASPIAGVAQSDCVTLPKAEGVLNSVARYFLDDGEQPVRERLFAKVDSAAPRFLLRDASRCQQIMRKVTSIFQKAGDWQALQSRGFQFAMYQIGPYYAVVVWPLDPPGKTSLARVPMLVFRATKQIKYLGTILV